MTLVVDASAVAEFLLGTAAGQIVAAIVTADPDLHAPHLLVPETVSVIRGWALGGRVDDTRAGIALSDLAAMPVRLWDMRPFIPEVWQLRHNHSAYDAMYVAVARGLGCDLVTADRRLAQTAARVAGVRYVESSG